VSVKPLLNIFFPFLFTDSSASCGDCIGP